MRKLFGVIPESPLYIPLERIPSLYGVVQKRVERAIHEGELPAFRKGKVVLVKSTDLVAWIESEPYEYRPRGVAK